MEKGKKCYHQCPICGTVWGEPKKCDLKFYGIRCWECVDRFGFMKFYNPHFYNHLQYGGTRT